MIYLERFNTDDFERLISWAHSEEFLIQFAGSLFSYPLTEIQLTNYLQDSTRKIFRVALSENHNIIGHCELNNIDIKNESALVSRVLIGDPDYRNKGYGKLIINSLLNIAFNDMKLHRVELNVFDFNEGAINCYKSIGFKIEGLLRENCKFQGKFWSCYKMAILSNEWHGLKISQL